MPWRLARRSVSAPLVMTVALSATILLSCVLTRPVAAVDTQVGAKVCAEQVTEAQLSITQPNDDSLVSVPVVTIRGTVWNASQIILEVDGSYNSTLAIAANQSTFSSDISLTEGTHTIIATANEICGGADGVDSIVVTYQPATQPSSGSETPTDLDGTVTLDGKPAQPIPSPEPVNPAESIPVIGNVVGLVSDFATAIGLQTTVAGNGVSTVGGAARVGLTVAALTSVVMAGTLAPVAAQAVPGISEVFDSGSHRSMVYLGWIIRGVGVLVLALAYFI